ncbi:hypothetical protein DFP72DRAFT_1167346 [Ephemerocybe angulata]|uniref:Uncharacterized protein n=1 Tax=Ephemerocybe angulata TaxID=980116 RepID=A0A8H6M798_9AGAR|nr:hypothetical protein DFP72DRAFT_1167346 [Tulosesus angulatus]
MASNDNLLSRLSNEVFGLIIDELEQIDNLSLCDLRLACRATNGLVEPKLFSSAFISFQPSISAEVALFMTQKVKAMASGQSPSSRHATNLVIGDIEGDRTSASPFYSYLVPAIEALKEVRCASIKITSECSEGVLPALACLPALQDLALRGPLTSRSKAYPLELCRFSHLRAIAFTSIILSAPVVEEIKRIISLNRDTLECITIRPNDWQPINAAWAMWLTSQEPVKPALIKLDVFFDGPVLPKVKEMAINGDSITLSASIMRQLHSLTALEIKNGLAAAIPDSVWRSMGDAGVYLERLTYWPLSLAAVKYLTSYQGLTSFRLAAPAVWPVQYRIDEEPPDDNPRAIFDDVLRHHSKSLRKLFFSNLGTSSYGCTEQNVEAVLRCGKLDTLELVYELGHIDRSLPQQERTISKTTCMDFSSLLTHINASLPNLHTLRVMPKRAAHRAHPYTSAAYNATHFRDMTDDCAEAICAAKVDLKGKVGVPAFTVELSATGKYGDCYVVNLVLLRYERNSRHFGRVCGEPGDMDF